MEKNRKTPSLKSLENALEVLDLIGASMNPLTATEISKSLGSSLSAVYKILITFMEKEYVSFDRISKQYSLHTKFLRFAHSMYEDRSYIEIALPVMFSIAQQTKETIHFGIPEGYYGVFIEKVNSPHTVGVQTRIGTRTPFNRGATSKAMMAFLSEERFEDFCHNFLDDGSQKGLQSIDIARKEREQIRKQGYAITHEEVNPNVAAVAAPVFGFTNKIVGSIAIAGPCNRFSDSIVTNYIEIIIEASKTISKKLGATDL